MRRALLLGCALATAGFTVVRDSDSLEPILWTSNTITVVVHDGMSSAENTAAQNSLTAWSSVGCSGFQLQYGGTGGAGDAQDGTNRISFLTSGWPGGSGVVGLTTRYRSAGSPDTWNEADIILNADPGSGATWTWSTDGRVGAYDVQSTVTHELGHVVGLMHTPSPEATMYFGGRRARTMWRTLHADDIAGICYLYPAGTFSCTTDDECPLFDNFYGGTDQRTVCSGGNCVVGGSDVYGDACYDGGDCQSGNCLKGLDLAPGIDPGFCTQGCGSCPDGDLCDGACHLGYDDCVVDSDCDSNWFCPMDLDGRFRCLRLCQTTGDHCDTGDPRTEGMVCHHNEDGPGFCRLPGPRGDGTTCDHGYDCASLICAGLGVQPVCVGGVGQDGSPPEDGAPQQDGAPAQDGVPQGDPATAADGATLGDGYAPSGDSDNGAVTGGCACSEKGDSYLFLFVACFALSRRLRPLFHRAG